MVRVYKVITENILWHMQACRYREL